MLAWTPGCCIRVMAGTKRRTESGWQSATLMVKRVACPRRPYSRVRRSPQTELLVPQRSHLIQILSGQSSDTDPEERFFHRDQTRQPDCGGFLQTGFLPIDHRQIEETAMRDRGDSTDEAIGTEVHQYQNRSTLAPCPEVKGKTQTYTSPSSTVLVIDCVFLCVITQKLLIGRLAPCGVLGIHVHNNHNRHLSL